MSSIDTNHQPIKFGPVRIKRRFQRPESPEDFQYGFVFRLIYCLVAYFCSVIFVFLASGLALLLGFDMISGGGTALGVFAIAVFSVPLFFGEVLRRRILDLAEKSDEGSVLFELDSSGLALDGDKILNRGNISSSSAQKPSRFYATGGKRLMDLLLVISAMPFLAPLLLIIALMIRFSDPGPVIYRQERIGKDGKIFRMLKFRTMVADAETVLESHLEGNELARQEWHSKQMLSYDPRVTKIGKTLRNTSIDELPQIWNVLTGDMSLVGPRPFTPTQKALYPGTVYQRLRPGLTGYWQITSRSESSFEDRAKYDEAYEQDMSFSTDAMIVARTIVVVVRATGV